jgi:hypothetical protein
MIGEMMTLLENVWFSLNLEKYRLHPIHAGCRDGLGIWSIRMTWSRIPSSRR